MPLARSIFVWAQQSIRLSYTLEVPGSIPAGPNTFSQLIKSIYRPSACNELMPCLCTFQTMKSGHFVNQFTAPWCLNYTPASPSVPVYIHVPGILYPPPLPPPLIPSLPPPSLPPSLLCSGISSQHVRRRAQGCTRASIGSQMNYPTSRAKHMYILHSTQILGFANTLHIHHGT